MARQAVYYGGGGGDRPPGCILSVVNSSRKEPGVRLLIAIPVYNERQYVQQVLDKVKLHHDQVLVVDDGSTDGTAQYLQSRPDIHLIGHLENRGYGRSLIDAFAFADANGYDWVITMDCDEQHEPERIPDFVKAIEQDRWDIISGSRYLRAMTDNDLPPGDRRTINETITSLINNLFDANLTDAFCGFKAHRISAIRKLNLDEPGYAFPMQLWPQAFTAGLRITEIPVRLIYNDPNRHFGGMLDDAGNRLRHYQEVLSDQMKRLGARSEPADEVCSGCGQ